MKSNWSERESKAYIARYRKMGVNKDLALRVYTTRLLGRDPALVLHGGGNTSVKTRVKDRMGCPVDVLCVKGSGWDMGDIEPQGLPAVRLNAIVELQNLDVLSDEDMVNAQRCALLDATSPNPSVETLLHAFLPHKFVDHTHSTAVLSVSDQNNGVQICRDLYGDRMGIVPYIMPGFDLAKKASEVFAQDPSVDGLILDKHGIFTFGDSAEEAYERMIEKVSLAEGRIKKAKNKSLKKSLVPVCLPASRAALCEVAPIVRGLLADISLGGGDSIKRMVLDFRTSPAIKAYVAGRDLGRYAQTGVVTPDHTIRTKNWPLIVPAPAKGKIDEFAKTSKAAVDGFVKRYHAYFRKNNRRLGGIKKELDPMPRVVLVPGLGLFGAGASKGAAKIAADIATNTVGTILDAESIGRYQCVGEADMFDLEYWSLEQAKLGNAAEKLLARHVVAITGGASGIGLATARAFRAQGAEVAILDRSKKMLSHATVTTGAFGVVCDVTNPASVKAGFKTICEQFGGLDILVSNAGRAWQGRIGDVDEKTLRDSFELNFYGHQRVAQAAVAIMRQQGTGGVLLFNTSKQAVNPGADFGPYGLPKATTLFLMRQYAVDHGADGIRSNAVNADRIRSGLLTDDMIDTRARARGVDKREYMSGNLLGREVTADDVAKAFVDLALSEKTTGAVLTVDGGNIAAALR